MTKTNSSEYKHNKGQYFTKNIELQEKVYSLINNNPQLILEPSVGRGDLVQYVTNQYKENNKQVKFNLYEIDKKINFLPDIKQAIIFGDFLEQEINNTYDTIIGNPPYVKTKKGNLYIDFIDKCYNLLNENGELIFIVPSDFTKLTSASKILNKMIKNGTFTDIYHPNSENLFEDASIDIIIFRYCKNINLNKKVIYNGKELYINNSNGLITFSEQKEEHNKLVSDDFDIYVGLVSGKDEIYKNQELGNIELLTSENIYSKYIFIDDFPSSNKKINPYLLKNKSTLLKRKIRKFTERNWYEWGAPRNIKVMQKYHGQSCIYIYNLTRKEKIAFKGNISYFGGTLIMLKPKNIDINLDEYINYFNNDRFKSNFMYASRFKIGHRQISNSFIDIK